MESQPLFPISPSFTTITFAKRQIITPKNILSVVVLTTSSTWPLVRGLIVIVTSSTLFCPCAFAFIFYNLTIRTEQSYRLVASAGNPDAQSDALVTIPSQTVGHKIPMAQVSIQGDPTILRHLYWSTGGEKDGFSIIGFTGEVKKDDT